MVTPDTTSSSRGFLKSGIGKRFQGARNQTGDGAENEAYSVVQRNAFQNTIVKQSLQSTAKVKNSSVVDTLLQRRCLYRSIDTIYSCPLQLSLD